MNVQEICIVSPHRSHLRVLTRILRTFEGGVCIRMSPYAICFDSNLLGVSCKRFMTKRRGDKFHKKYRADAGISAAGEDEEDEE